MLLAVDIGNTSSVFAVFDDGALREFWRADTQDIMYANPFMGLDSEDIDKVIISSVVPYVNDAVQKFSQQHFRTDPIFVTAALTKLTIDMPNPAEVGADRLVNAVAMKALYQTPAIVIDFGTATTFDVIDEKGAYCGGAIAPGVNLSIETLHKAAAQLPKIELKNPGVAIGKSTVEAMQAGLYWGYIGMVEGVVARISDEMGVKPYVLATG